MFVKTSVWMCHEYFLTVRAFTVPLDEMVT